VVEYQILHLLHWGLISGEAALELGGTKPELAVSAN